MPKPKYLWRLPVRRPWIMVAAGMAALGLSILLVTPPLGSLKLEGSLLELSRKSDPHVRRWRILRETFGGYLGVTVFFDNLKGPADEVQKRLAETSRLVAEQVAEAVAAVPLADTRPASMLVLMRGAWGLRARKERKGSAVRTALGRIAPELAVTVHAEPDLDSPARLAATFLNRQRVTLIAGVFLLSLLLFGGGLRTVACTLLVGLISAAVTGAVAALSWGKLHPGAVVWAFPALVAAAYLPTRVVLAVDRAPPGPKKERVGEALDRQVGPVCLAAGTVTLCLVALGASRFMGVRWPALLAGLATGVAAAATLTVVPAVLRLWPGRWNEKPSESRWLARWAGSVRQGAARFHLPLLLFAAAAAVALGWAGLQGRIDHKFGTRPGTAEKAKTVHLSLLVWSRSSERLDHPDTTGALSKLKDRLLAHPGIVGVITPPDLKTADPRLRRLYHSVQGPALRVSVLAQLRGSWDTRSLMAWINKQSLRILPADLRAHVTGRAAVTSAVADAVAKAQIVGVARFLGMLLLVMTALTVDPRLGLTAAAPAGLAFLALPAFMAAASWPLDMLLSAAIFTTVVLGAIDGVLSLLEVAHRRTLPPNSPSNATAASVRVVLCLLLFTATVATVANGAAFRSAVLSAAGLVLASALCATVVPSLLAFMPQARIHGPLWEPPRRRRFRP